MHLSGIFARFHSLVGTYEQREGFCEAGYPTEARHSEMNEFYVFGGDVWNVSLHQDD
jgi:hypothetical protein